MGKPGRIPSCCQLESRPPPSLGTTTRGRATWVAVGGDGASAHPPPPCEGTRAAHMPRRHSGPAWGRVCQGRAGQGSSCRLSSATGAPLPCLRRARAHVQPLSRGTDGSETLPSQPASQLACLSSSRRRRGGGGTGVGTFATRRDLGFYLGDDEARPLPCRQAPPTSQHNSQSQLVLPAPRPATT